MNQDLTEITKAMFASGMRESSSGEIATEDHITYPFMIQLLRYSCSCSWFINSM